MKKIISFLSFLAVALILLSLGACREEFLPDFADVETRNLPPKVSSPIGDVLLTPGFGTHELDLNNYISDPEGDPIAYTATNSDDAVVTIKLDGSVLEISEVGPGTSTVAVTASDGNEGNVTSTEFDIIVEDVGFTWFTFFDLPDGTDLQGLYHNGATFSYEGFEGASIIVQDGALEWVVPEWCGLSIEFDEPLDLSGNSLFQFDYADMFGEEIWFGFEDTEGEGAWDVFFADEFGGSFVLNSPEFNTFDEFYLGDYANWDGAAVDMSQISLIYFEMAGADEANPPTWRVDNIFIGNLDE